MQFLDLNDLREPHSIPTLFAHTRCHLDLQALDDFEEVLENTSLATAVQVEPLKFEPSADSDLCCANDARRAFSVSVVQWVRSERSPVFEPFFRGLDLDDDDAMMHAMDARTLAGVDKGIF